MNKYCIYILLTLGLLISKDRQHQEELIKKNELNKSLSIKSKYSTKKIIIAVSILITAAAICAGLCFYLNQRPLSYLSREYTKYKEYMLPV